jgi:hypothetical protein
LSSAFLANLSSPPLLFFFLGMIAVFVRSDLDIPGQIARFLSLYLLFAIGFKGGVALASTSLEPSVFLALGAAMLLSAAVPVYSFFLLRARFGVANAAAIAATYGSVSAVTFITATSYLDNQGIEWSGYLVAAMALMESPAIIVGMLLYSRFRDDDTTRGRLRWGPLLHEACLNGSVFLILGSMVIGYVSGPEGMAQIAPVVTAPFLGVLCLFLLDMGIVAARRLRDLGDAEGPSKLPLGLMLGASLAFPLLNGAAALAIGHALGLREGDLVLLTVLGASASYIAVPAAMRLALPQASPSIYLPMSLAITFPFNILLGIPLYHLAAQWLL